MNLLNSFSLLKLYILWKLSLSISIAWEKNYCSISMEWTNDEV